MEFIDGSGIQAGTVCMCSVLQSKLNRLHVSPPGAHNKNQTIDVSIQWGTQMLSCINKEVQQIREFWYEL